MVFLNGDDWRRHRTFIHSAFTSPSYKTYFPIFQQTTLKFLSILETLGTGDFDINPWYSKFTVDVLGKSIFNYDLQNLDMKQNEYYEAYKVILSNGGILNSILVMMVPWVEYLPLPGVLRVKRALAKMNELFEKVIEEKKNGKNQGDMLDHLLEAARNDQSLPMVELFSDIFIFFVAGHETTATALSYATAELAANQDVQERLYQDIQKRFGDGLPDFEAVFEEGAKIPYLDWFLQENLRLHPPVTILPTRVAVSDIEYKGQVIPKGTQVGLGIETIHMNPEVWEDPRRFDPERFSPEKKKGRHKFAFLPFSLGPRQCIGTEFSEIEQRLFLIHFLKKFKVLPPETLPSKDLTKNSSLSRPNHFSTLHILQQLMQPR
uniref:Cytochrome P450 n=1 Tax=Arcella intermedia TaxID=1963864 RepID=A0A6B2L712_9EUKA